MVTERVVLRRVEHFEQGGGRVAPVVRTDLVDLVEDDDRVHGPGLAQGTDQTARLGPDIGATVTPDLGLVTHPAERDADELAPECVGHRFPEGRLADARRPHQSQDGARTTAVDGCEPALSLQFAHGQVLEDALLHIGQTVVVGLQNA